MRDSRLHYDIRRGNTGGTRLHYLYARTGGVLAIYYVVVGFTLLPSRFRGLIFVRSRYARASEIVEPVARVFRPTGAPADHMWPPCPRKVAPKWSGTDWSHVTDRSGERAYRAMLTEFQSLNRIRNYAATVGQGTGYFQSGEVKLWRYLFTTNDTSSLAQRVQRAFLIGFPALAGESARNFAETRAALLSGRTRSYAIFSELWF